MPRTYNLGRRAEPKAATRSRIVAAAMRIYRDRGMSAASNLAVARAADVAPATVRNHFPERADLARAVFDSMLENLDVPTAAIFEGTHGLRDRIERLAQELARFYERTVPWWRAYEREPDLIQAWGGGVDQYYADVDALMREALGPLGSDATSLAVVSSVIGPPTFFGLQARGLTSEEAVRLTVELAVPWLDRRLASLAGAEAGNAVPTG